MAVTGKRGCLAVLGTALLLVALLAIAALVAWRDYLHFAETPVSASAPSVVIAPGDSLKATLHKLRAAGVAQGTDLNGSCSRARSMRLASSRWANTRWRRRFRRASCSDACARAG